MFSASATNSGNGALLVFFYDVTELASPRLISHLQSLWETISTKSFTLITK